jgi:hypothetical protein
MKKLLLSLALLLVLCGTVEATPQCWFNHPITGGCWQWIPELLPGARWCDSSSPTENEAFIYSSLNFQAYPFCQAITVPSQGIAYPDLQSVGWRGYPYTFSIMSVWVGSHTMFVGYQRSNFWGDWTFGYPGTKWTKTDAGYVVPNSIYFLH